MGRILFVCTGNLCRSPMAAGFLCQRLARDGLGGRHQVVSRGVWAIDGQPASRYAIQVMAERAIDIADHVAQTISAEDLAEADLVLVMAREHAGALGTTWPQYSWKVHLLSEMIGKRQDVQDPYGRSLEVYQNCADTIARMIDGGLSAILALV